MKRNSGKKAIKILKRAMRSTYRMTGYKESLPDEGIAEVLIFNVCCGLFYERDEDVMEDTLITLIRYISNDRKSEFSIDDVATHVSRRVGFYKGIIESILENPSGYDLKPLYGAWYRSPFTDINYFVGEPKDATEFRWRIEKMMCRILRSTT